MSRARKLLIVGLVLVVGVGLAWPFRNAGPRFAPPEPASIPALPIREVPLVASPPAPVVVPVAPALPAVEHQVAATMTSTGEGAHPAKTDPSFDLENHPALAHESREAPPETNAFTAPEQKPAHEARPAYDTVSTTPTAEATWPEEVLHVVQNGDTLEKLAQRYLGDESRALELFDLNRDQLTNPHLLPIGAELRIPIPPRQDVD